MYSEFTLNRMTFLTIVGNILKEFCDHANIMNTDDWEKFNVEADMDSFTVKICIDDDSSLLIDVTPQSSVVSIDDKIPSVLGQGFYFVGVEWYVDDMDNIGKDIVSVYYDILSHYNTSSIGAKPADKFDERMEIKNSIKYVNEYNPITNVYVY